MSIHNEAKKEDIMKTVLMPGDPLRAKYIAENFMTDVRLVNEVRGMYAFTGKYKGKEITVMGSGMGMPSMGIYCYELYKFYDVENIIRIGSCGGYDERLDVLDTVLVKGSYNEGNFAKNYSGEEKHFETSSDYLNDIIIKAANENGINLKIGNMSTTECFDVYTDGAELYLERLPKEYEIMGVEMESFALFYTAHKLGKNAACLLTVSDSLINKKELTADERQNSMNDMIKAALEASLKL